MVAARSKHNQVLECKIIYLQYGAVTKATATATATTTTTTTTATSTTTAAATYYYYYYYYLQAVIFIRRRLGRDNSKLR